MAKKTDDSIADVQPGQWPANGGGTHNPFLTPLNRESERRQDRGRKP